MAGHTMTRTPHTSRRMRAGLRRWLTSWIADDPYPGYSRLDGLDGLDGPSRSGRPPTAVTDTDDGSGADSAEDSPDDGATVELAGTAPALSY